MSKQQYIIISIISFLLSLLFVAIHKEWIIIPLQQQRLTRSQVAIACTKKTVRLYCWQHDRWHHEDTDILWTDIPQQNIHQLMSRWLALMDEESLIPHKITLQTALISPTQQEMYLSLDRYPFDEEAATYEKLMFIEGILKTLRENKITIPFIHFLVHHQPLQDTHLDFSHPWPLQGFVQQT